MTDRSSVAFRTIGGRQALLGAGDSLEGVNTTGGALQMQATGVAGVTLNWVAHLEVWSTEFVG